MFSSLEAQPFRLMKAAPEQQVNNQNTNDYKTSYEGEAVSVFIGMG